jgi:hypothetical protein
MPDTSPPTRPATIVDDRPHDAAVDERPHPSPRPEILKLVDEMLSTVTVGYLTRLRFEAARAALLSEIARLSEDSERLDWLEATKPALMGGSKISVWFNDGTDDNSWHTAQVCEESWREAIDAARTSGSTPR